MTNLAPLLPDYEIDADLLRETAESFGVRGKPRDVWKWIAVAYRRAAWLAAQDIACMSHEQCRDGDHYSACPAYVGG